MNGGRWNSVGTRIVYAASSLSLATLELLVHIEDLSAVEENYCVFRMDFDASLLEHLSQAKLPDDWDDEEPVPETQFIGDQWIAAGSSVALQVPSAVTAGEVNYLFNPEHAHFSKVKIGRPVDFKLDKRLR